MLGTKVTGIRRQESKKSSAKAHTAGQATTSEPMPCVGFKVVIYEGDTVLASGEGCVEGVIKVCEGLVVIVSQSWHWCWPTKELFI